MRSFKVAVVVLLMATTVSARCVGQVSQIKAIKITTPPNMDGRLDDDCWQRPADADKFLFLETQTPASENTQAWICYDSENIYVAFRCFDSQPDKITSQQKKRNGSFATDDWVGVDIDPWHTHASIYWFDVNSIGTQAESLPGAGGSKIEWLGDWNGAAKMFDSGWTAEMAIPWSIFKYPKNQTSMGIAFIRRHARSTQWWWSPNLGPNNDNTLMFDWVDIEPPSPKLNNIALSYTNIGVGGVHLKNGIDLKKQLSQQVNSLLTVNPDFDSIEQDVESIDFSYSPRVLTDNRPFFAEGGDAQQDGEYRMFYSRDISKVDAGAKIAGQTGKQTFSGLATTAGGGDRHIFYKSRWNLGKANRLGFAATSTHESGIDNNVVSAYGRLGKTTSKRTDLMEYRLMKSFTPGAGGDGSITVAGAGGEGGPKQLGWGIWYQDVQPDYFAADGIVPDPDLKGWDYHLSYGNEYAKGLLRGYRLVLDGISQWVHSNDLLERSLSLGLSAWSVNQQAQLGFYRGDRRHESLNEPGIFDVYGDMVYSLGYAWNLSDMYWRGYIDTQFGRRAGGHLFRTLIRQAIKLGGNFHSDFSVEFLHMTGPYAQNEHQSIASLSYDISNEKSISARIIEHDGAFNASFGFRQAVRRGEDIFLLFGDPNADRTKNRIILKLIRPLF